MEALLLAVVIGLLVGAGWYAIEPVYHWAVRKMKAMHGEAKSFLPFLLTFFR